MNLPRQNFLLYAFCLFFLLSSCQDKWGEHNDVGDPLLAADLLVQINKDPQLSKFSEYLVKTGLDQVIASSKTFTIWAPTNSALQNLDQSLISTDEKLKVFVANHIANQSYFTADVKQSFLRIKTLNGKNVTFTTTSVDGVNLESKDLYVGNGVLHTINNAIIPKMNAWEYLMSTSTIQKSVLQSFNYLTRDTLNSEIIGIDPVTGKPIYKEGSGIVERNSFLVRRFRNLADANAEPSSTDINSEDRFFTYIILTDQAFEAERTKLSRYYVLDSQDSIDKLTNFNIIKDFAFEGVLNKDNFPQTVYSIGDSVKFHLDKNAIVETHNVSNGIVYVMNSVNYELGNGQYDPYTKIKPLLIQGESANNNTDFLSVKTNSRNVRRDKDGNLFTQLRVENHGTSSYWVRYRPAIVNSVKYKVYWRVVREENLVPAANAVDLVYYPLRIAFKSTAVTSGFPYIAKPGVVSNGQTFSPDYSEVYLGEYTAERYYSRDLKFGVLSALPIYLVGNTTPGNGTNTLLLDYIKMVPVLP